MSVSISINERILALSRIAAGIIKPVMTRYQAIISSELHALAPRVFLLAISLGPSTGVRAVIVLAPPTSPAHAMPITSPSSTGAPAAAAAPTAAISITNRASGPVYLLYGGKRALQTIKVGEVVHLAVPLPNSVRTQPSATAEHPFTVGMWIPANETVNDTVSAASDSDARERRATDAEPPMIAALSYLVPAGGRIEVLGFPSRRDHSGKSATVFSAPDETVMLAALQQRAAAQTEPVFGNPLRCAEVFLSGPISNAVVTASLPVVVSSGSAHLMFDESGAAFRWIVPGVFTGANRVKGAERPTITITKGFWIGLTELSRGQAAYWQGKQPQAATKADFPQDEISWDAVHLLIQQMNKQTGRTYDFPSEAQWEYVAQAGRLREFGSALPVTDIAWFNTNAQGKARKVATKRPSDWGIFDMHGNVREWCRCGFGVVPPSGTDPEAGTSGTRKVVRGGGAGWPPVFGRSGSRDYADHDTAIELIGVRLIIQEIPGVSPPTPAVAIPKGD